MMNLAILGSTRGTNMLAIIDAIANHQLNANITVVISNKSDALILERAKSHNLPNLFVDAKNLSREEYDKKISILLKEHQIDLVVLIGYMRILSADFVNEWQNKIINVHPSLLPLHAGKMDLDVHRSVIGAQEKETGCTVHYVTAEVDAGPIIIQSKCPVFETDTPDNLKQRVQALEGAALIDAIKIISF